MTFTLLASHDGGMSEDSEDMGDLHIASESRRWYK